MTILLSMTTKGNSLYNPLIINTLSKISSINKWRQTFLLEAFMLFLSIKGRINFLQLARYGKYTEQRYRQQFEKRFGFLSFNKGLLLAHGSGHYVIAFDPSYISKAGKHTPGVSWYWSGCAGQAKWGLEIGGLAAIDIDNHTAIHLEAVQTLYDKETQKTLTGWYADVITDRADTLSTISKYVVADAWFSKKPFLDRITDLNMHLISRLRDDADLRYLYTQKQSGSRGRPKKYAGKVDSKNIDKSVFTLVKGNDDCIVHTAIVYAKAFKANIKVLHVTYSKNGKQSHKLYFTTDLDLDATLILTYYQARFQIEFPYRDGKQHTGLMHSQARSENKIHFQTNAALTAINIAKITHWFTLDKQERKTFSMTDIKTLNHNTLLLNRFFSVFGINPNLTKNQKNVKELIYYGTIAA